MIGRRRLAGSRDIAAEALSEIADIWNVDHARVIARDNGFDWWPEEFKVSVTAVRRTDGYVPETWQLCVKTDFLKDIPVDDARFVKFVGANSGVWGSTYAWAFPAKEVWEHYRTPGSTPRLWFANTAYLTAENASWLPAFLAHMSILQPINARLASQANELLFGGVPDSSTSRLLGRAKQSDVLTNTIASYAQAGNGVNRWLTTDEFETLANDWRRLPGSFCDANDHGFVLQMQMDAEYPAVIRLTTEAHPQLGEGLLGNVKLPIFDDTVKIAEQCATWNLTDTMWKDIPQFGCWHPFVVDDDLASPQFSSFIPNALFGKGIASLTVLWLYQKFRAAVYNECPTPS